MKKLIAVFILLALAAHVSVTYSQPAKEQSLIYFIPADNSQNNSPTTSLAIRAGAPFAASATELNLFDVTGSKSGRHSGKSVLSDDALTLIFYPNQPFEYGETVTVTVRSGLKTAENNPVSETTFHFTTLSQPLDPAILESVFRQVELKPATPPNAPTANGQEIYYTHPEFTNIMTRTVTTPAQNTGDGFIFIAAAGPFYGGQSALLILDNTGDPILIDTLYGDPFVGDFKKQTVDGTDYLTYHAGVIPGGYTHGTSYVLDENYQVVDTWTIDNGLGADVHDFLLLDNGHAIQLAYVPIPFDFTPYGGPADGTLIDIVLQEQDSDKNVVFEWHASQHMPIEDTQMDLNTTNPVDFLHTNGIAVDNDGNWLLSHRHFSEITKINSQTGDIIWRMGGAGNEFTFTNDIGFYNQHNINRLDNGNITLFDNGNYHTPPHSRAIEYAVDEVAKTVTRVWMYPEDTSEFSSAMANVQRLPNGNSMIGWGSQPKLTEVQDDGTIAVEMLLGGLSYRAFRFPWSGTPFEAPRAVVRYDADPTAVTMYTSWNGATNITGYNVFAGPTPNNLSMVDNAPRDGFETEISITGLPADTCFFQTKPVHAQGGPTPFSNITFRADLAVCWELLEHSFMPITTK